jgi:oxepin-CoA hydrolase/3-oxo-5,6-dehydrosuberyl-CoA semialdehyde dehydrogenase
MPNPVETLESYVLSRWQRGTGDPTPLHDPTSEEPIAEVRSGGIDFQAVLEAARGQGGPALRSMSFRERGALLKGLSGAIHERREDLIAASVRNGGTTRGDAKFDVDGAIGTLAAYAALAEKLPDRPFLVDGEGMQLGRTGRFWGQHVWVTRPGVAVHVNAFNFPAWGMTEKMACALLAGVPVVEKPGTPTALVAARVARIVVDSGLLPPNAYQLVVGGVGDLLDHLRSEDCLAFTGSSATGAKLRGHANVVRRNVRVNVEADSLNAAVLAPDVEPGSDAWNLFLANVALDMTQKTGQKCTAVRRILVPEEKVEAVRADLTAELLRVKVGDPSEKETRMGPLSSKGQLEDVRAGIGRLAREAHVACGGPDPIRPKGWFVAPTLLVAREAGAAAFHAEEVFGPVATILPYSGDAALAAELVRLGGGGLVASAYSNDPDWTERFVLAAAPWNGRLWIGSDKLQDQATPPGLVLPNMIHGGPGRAGGGEELGGERGLHFYMQRTALQGFKGTIDGSFGGGNLGSARAGS